MRGIYVFLIITILCLGFMYMVEAGKVPYLKPKRFTPYVIINPYAYRNYYEIPEDENSTLERMLSIAKDLGFEGIGVYGLEGWMAENRLPLILNLIEDYGFEALIYINWLDLTRNVTDPNCWDQTGFPYNQTQVDAFLNYVGNISLIARDYVCVKGYVVQYPYWRGENLTEWWLHVVNSTEYKENLQKIINRIHSIDPEREIYLSNDMIEHHFVSDFYESSRVPYDFANITGFGFSCYSTKLNRYLDDLDYYYKFFKDMSKKYASGKVVFSEWGFKTNPYGNIEGRVRDEKEKAEWIKKVVEHTKPWDCPVCYFMLHDFPKEDNNDWGIITDNLTLKPSAYAFKETLNANKEWYEDPLFFGIVLFLIILGIFAFYLVYKSF